MVDEKNDYEDQEESEYHFSDDQSTYELEPEIDGNAAVSGGAATAKESLLAQTRKYRRTLIIVAAFFILLFVVYKLIIPATTSAPVTEFTDTTSGSNAAVPNAAKPLVPVQTTTTTTTVVQTPTKTAESQASMRPPMEQPNPMAMTTPPSQQMVMPQQLPQSLPPPSSSEILPPVVSSPTASAEQLPPPVVMNQQQTTLPPAPGLSNPVTDRVATLEQQNARIMNVVGTDYAQKMAEYETQNMAMQAKIREMNTKLSTMETTLNQITQMLLNRSSSGGSPAAQPIERTSPMMGMMPPAAPMMKSSNPKMIYTVQAIIPGRAWLKAENGDTVTVAEGDVLRDYGRIAKIDPYDGVVDIDTGAKTISLSYGTGSEA